MSVRVRICQRCKDPIREARPVFLVGMGSGDIVGPFHAQCAAGLAAQARLLGHEPDMDAKVVGRVVTGEVWEQHAISDPTKEVE